MTIYVVKSGDNLTDIANKYGVTMGDIKQLKKTEIVNKNLLMVGDILAIPLSLKQVEASLPVSYVVRSGDNLTAIAKKYGVTVNSILTMNRIKNANYIYPGQVLAIFK